MRYSTAAHNPEGLREKELKARHLKEKPAGKQFKHRHRCQLSSEAIEEIVAACDEGSLTQAEIAKKYKVKMILVSSLVTEARKQPEKLRVLKQKEKELGRASRAVERVAAGMLERSIPIDNAMKVQRQAEQYHAVEISVPKVRTMLKKELGLGYRRARQVPIQGNSERCLVLRQQYSLKMLGLIE